MTIYEAFEQWKKEDASKSDLCLYGGIDGGPGYIGFGSCDNENHPNVRYGCEYCPKDCKDFYMTTESRLFNIFEIEYDNNREYFNKKYNIDENDPRYKSHIKTELSTAQANSTRYDVQAHYEKLNSDYEDIF